MIGIAAIPAAIMLVLMLRLPESPRWLVKNDQVDEARSNLQRVRGEDDVERELNDIVKVEEQVTRSRCTRLERTGSAVGAPGPHRRLRDSGVHPA